MKNPGVYLISAGMMICASCEREIHLDLPQNIDQQVVVEGSIATGIPPVVRLTHSIGFFDMITMQTLSGLYLHGADIKVSDGSKTVTLKEYTIDTSGYDVCFYTVDSANAQDLAFVGVVNKTYQLSITYNSKTYTSSTTLPRVKPIDSMWAQVPDDIPSDNPDAMELRIRYTDPDTLGNRVRVFTSVNGGAFLTSFFSVYNDQLINGTTVDLTIEPGYVKMDSIKQNDQLYFKKGDTVVLDWAAIDYNVYTFWNTLEFSANANGNPFSSPTQVISNVSNGALGVWAAYGNSFDTLVIPR